jgi:hypothetical protein
MASLDSLLHEAQSSNTESDRLWEIKCSSFSGLTPPEIKALICALVDHPNADEDLCMELLREWPNETLASTRFRLMLVADSEMNWSNIFDEFCNALPALQSLVEIPSSHKAIISLFEAELLSRFDGLSCRFDWKMSCSHEISIDWQPANELEEQGDNGDDLTERSQDFTVSLLGTIDNENALLESPGKVNDIKRLFAELDANESVVKLFEILERHGWVCSNCASGDGGYFELDSVEPALDEWNFSEYSITVDGSGTLCVTDPSEKEHEIDLPAGVLEHSFENYRLDELFALPDIFDHDMEALDAFRKIVSLSEQCR